ncbi:MAG: phosphatidate cytidylyltransferase [Bacteriovoracia bacterium]
MTAHTETITRVKTGVLGGIIFLGFLIFGGSMGVTFAAALIGAMMCWELSSIFYKLEDRREKMISLVGTGWLSIFINMLFPRMQIECLILAFVGLFAYYLASAERHPKQLQQHFEEFAFSVFSLVYVVVFIEFLPLVRQAPHGIHWLLTYLIILWVGDSGAYFIGKKYGKQKLYPLISPGKTVEGALGAIGASVVAIVLFKLFAFKSLSWFGALIIPVVISVISQIGDLCESLLKRAYAIKDTSHVLPGHGGFLDRFDGFLYALPIMYFCVKIFG